MSIVTPTELALLRSRPQQSEPRLVIYKPDTVFACRVNDASILKGAIYITYDTVSAGAFGDINDGMTMYVGTSAGKADIGRVRVKVASATVLSVAENGLDWADNLYLTVVNFYELWPKSSLDVISGGTNIIHYVDYDIAYANQNFLMGTMLCIGPPGVCEAGESIHWLSTGSIQTESMGLDYEWSFGGGSPVSGSSSDPGMVQYSTPGYYMTEVTAVVTGTNISDTTYRPVIILGGSIQPYKQWGFDSIDGSRDEGGWTAKLWLREEILPEVMDGSLCIIYQDSWYGSTKQNIGGNAPNRQKILFVGYIVDNSITYNFREGKMEFTISSPTGRMKLLEGLSTSMDNIGTVPTAWQRIQNLTGKKALYYYLRWHTTVLNCCDVHWMIDPDPEIPSWDSEISSIYDIVQKFADVYYLGEVVSDRQGAIWVEKHPKSLHAVTGSYRTVLDMDRQDWLGDIDVTEQLNSPISYLEMHGLGYAGIVTGTLTDYLSAAPYINKRSPFGRADFIQGYVVSSQDENNQIVGDVYAYMNARFPSVDVKLAGWYSLFDIAPEECVNLSTIREDTPRGFVWGRKPFILREMGIEWDANNRTLLPIITLHEITQGTAGATVPIPTPVEPPLYPDFPPITGSWTDIPLPFDWPKPWVEPPTPGNACRGDSTAEGNGPYGLAFDKTDLNTGESGVAYYPCYVRMSGAYNPTRVTLYGQLGSGADWTDISLVAIDGGQNTVVSGVLVMAKEIPGTPNSVATFQFGTATGTEVAGFKITVTGGSGGTGTCRIISDVIGTGSVGATDDVGTTIPGLTAGTLYCITQVGDYNMSFFDTSWFHSTTFKIIIDGWLSNLTGGQPTHMPWSGGSQLPQVPQVDRVGSTLDSYMYFIAGAVNKFITGDNDRADNAGTLSYAIYLAGRDANVQIASAQLWNICT